MKLWRIWCVREMIRSFNMLINLISVIRCFCISGLIKKKMLFGLLESSWIKMILMFYSIHSDIDVIHFIKYKHEICRWLWDIGSLCYILLARWKCLSIWNHCLSCLNLRMKMERRKKDKKKEKVRSKVKRRSKLSRRSNPNKKQKRRSDSQSYDI